MKNIHFVGIGGIGMSALAEIYLSKGFAISGSDLKLNNLTDRLSQKGAKIFEGHKRKNVLPETDLIVRSACIRDNNPELVKARELGIKVISRSELLKTLFDGADKTVGVTGTHGKTTTTALISHITEHCGMNPTILVGGEMDCFGGNAKYGKEDFVVSEVDESDGYFRNIRARLVVITNIEREHMENFGSMENLIGAYRAFISNIPLDGVLVYNGEDPVLVDVALSAKCRKISFGLDGDFNTTSRNIRFDKSIQFDFMMDGNMFGKVDSVLIGRHNIMNLMAAISICLLLGLDFEEIRDAVGKFKNARRRFDLVDKIGDIRVIEDYAHHPTEVRSVIKAAVDYAEGRVIAIFQPHRYTRTSDMVNEFVECFYGADVLVLTDVYSASEDPLAGVSTRNIFERIDKTKFETVKYLKKDQIPDFIGDIIKEKDLVLVMGAGDIRDISLPLSRNIRKKIKVYE
jgi:UDP-N-acetylmuramate--alanine ligase